MRPVQRLLPALPLLALVVANADAGVPDPRNSTVESVIVGNATGTPLGAPGSFGTSAVGGFEVIVRDINNSPQIGSFVVLDFSLTSIRLFTVQSAGTTVDCAGRTLAKTSGANGLALFTPRFGGYENADLVEVSADGVVLANVRARATDIDALGGRTGLGDLTRFANNFYANPLAPETDFDLSGSTGLGDLFLFAQEYAAPGEGTYCP